MLMPNTTTTTATSSIGHPSMSKSYRPVKLAKGGVCENDVTIGSNYDGNIQYKPKVHASQITTTSNKSREPYANNGRRILLSMALKQNYAWSKSGTQVATDIPPTEPMYFNVSIDRKFPINLFWEERQNSDLRRWIQHRRTIGYGTKKAIDDNLPPLHLDKISNNARIQQNRFSRVNKYIAAENQRIKQRLSRVKGKYDANKWKADYQSHVQISNHISKLPRPPSINATTVFQKITRPPTQPRIFSQNHSHEDVSDTQTISDRLDRSYAAVPPLKQNTHPMIPAPNQKTRKPLSTANRGQQPPRPAPTKANSNVIFTKRKTFNVTSKSQAVNNHTNEPMKDPREELAGPEDNTEVEFDNRSLGSQPTSPALPRRSHGETPVNDVYNYMKPFSAFNNTNMSEARPGKRSSIAEEQDRQTHTGTHTGMKVHFPGPATPSPDVIEDNDNDDVPLPKNVYRRTPVPQNDGPSEKDDDIIISPLADNVAKEPSNCDACDTGEKSRPTSAEKPKSEDGHDSPKNVAHHQVSPSASPRREETHENEEHITLSKASSPSPSALPSSPNPAQTNDDDITNRETTDVLPQKIKTPHPDGNVETSQTPERIPTALSERDAEDTVKMDNESPRSDLEVAKSTVPITEGMNNLTINEGQKSRSDLSERHVHDDEDHPNDNHDHKSEGGDGEDRNPEEAVHEDQASSRAVEKVDNEPDPGNVNHSFEVETHHSEAPQTETDAAPSGNSPALRNSPGPNEDTAAERDNSFFGS